MDGAVSVLGASSKASAKKPYNIFTNYTRGNDMSESNNEMRVPIEGLSESVEPSAMHNQCSLEAPATTAVSFEGPSTNEPTTPPNAMEGSLEGAVVRPGVPPPEPPPPNPTEMTAHQAEDVHMAQALPWPISGRGVNIDRRVGTYRGYAIASVCVPTRARPCENNFVHVPWWMRYRFGVKMKWTRREGWDRWHFTLTGPEYLFDEAARICEQSLTYPDNSEDSAVDVGW